MALMTWRQEYSVGVKTLDDDHAAFIACLNKLHAAMMKGQGQSVTGPLLHELIDLAHNHFFKEEALMAETNYPELANHRVHHLEIFKTVEEYLARHKKDDKSINVPLLNFMRDWLNEHLQKEDHAYVSWLSEHGVH